MFTKRLNANVLRHSSLTWLLLVSVAFAAASLARAQNPPQPPPQQPDQASPDAGGPGADAGAIALPKKKDKPEDAPLPVAPAAPKFKNPEGAPNFSLRIEVPEVTVDVGVLVQKTGQFIP